MKLGKILKPDVVKLSKEMALEHNVLIRVLDKATGECQSVHEGHNAATNSMMLGIAHYLTGDGVFNQGWDLLRNYVPQYISLGTMGLVNQEQDDKGLPAGVGVYEGPEEDRFMDYMKTVPSYGADGYDKYSNNSREYFGLGPSYANRPDKSKTVNCELISTSYPRVKVSYREIVPEAKAELPQTIDVVFSAMVSTGALAQFREPGKDYVFITEAGLWSRPDWVDGGSNGCLAAYRIAPPDNGNWDMSIEDNRDRLKKEIIKVNRNQVVQVIWKIQIGAIQQFNTDLIKDKLKWIEYDAQGGYGNLQKWPHWEGPNDNAPHSNILRWQEIASTR